MEGRKDGKMKRRNEGMKERWKDGKIRLLAFTFHGY
jgi:hypothetical protein